MTRTMRRVSRLGARWAALLGAIFVLQACAAAGFDGRDVARETATGSPAEDARLTQSLLQLGDDVYAGGDVVTAIAFYRRALARGDAAGPVLDRLGDALLALGSYEQAAGAFRSALLKSAGDADALRGLGAADLSLGQTAEGAQFLQQAAALRPDDLRVLRSLGVAYDMLGRHDEARVTYAKARKIAPEDVDVKSDLALSLALGGKPEDAVTVMRDAAASPYARPQHARNLVLVLMLAKRDAEASRVAKGAMPAAEGAALIAWAKGLRRIDAPTALAAAIGATAAR